MSSPAQSRSSSSSSSSPRVVLPQRQIWVVFGGLLLGTFLSSLDQTVVAPALPTIVRDLGTASQLSWVVTAYLLTSTLATGLWGQAQRSLWTQTHLSGLHRYLPTRIRSRWTPAIDAGVDRLPSLAGDRRRRAPGACPDHHWRHRLPRERGRYQGLLGAVFGVSSIAGPLVGGFLVDNFSWHWVFYVNLPIGLISLGVTALALPTTSSPRRGRLDWPGAAMLALATTALVLLASLGGTRFAWSSLPIIGLGVVAVLAGVAFVLVERTADEPVLAPRLFAHPVFAVGSVLSFAVGAILLGSISFLPTYLQVVKGASATASGLGLLPLIAGLLLTSTASGLIVSRTGRYKALPILGLGVNTAGVFLMSTMGVDTPTPWIAAYLFVFGFGLGLVMQVLTVAVQNVVRLADLGAATSGVSFFRSVGSVIGVTVFGAIYANSLVANLSASAAAGPVQTYANTLHNVFVGVLPVAALAFVVSWFLEEVPLRSTRVEVDPGDSGNEQLRAA